MNPLSVTQLRERTATCVPEVHRDGPLDVWLLSTRMTADERDSQWAELSADERARADRFCFDADRDRFIAARGGLRVMLSAYTATPPAQLAFDTNSHGKPSLSRPASPIEFNVSHSGDCVAIAITHGIACGVDIEHARAGRAELAIAEHFFSPRELVWLQATAGGFLRLWTAKEAILKAVGCGLSMIPLPEVDVADVLSGRTSAVVLDIPGLERRTIALTELTVPSGYAAAVAVDQPVLSERRILSPVEGARA